MKKRYTLLIALALVMSMTSCGSTSGDTSAKEPAATTTQEQAGGAAGLVDGASDESGGLAGLMDDSPAETTTTTAATETTTTTAKPAETTKAADTSVSTDGSGIYVLTKLISGGEEYYDETYDQMVIIFKDDGSVEMFGQPDKLTRDGNTITDGVDSVEYTLAGDTLTITDGDASMILKKTDKMPETTAAKTTDEPKIIYDDSDEAPIVTDPGKTETAAPSGDLGYAFWNGYSYSEDGQIRYKLECFKEAKLGFILHCWFRDGDPEWHEEMITLTDLKEGAQEVDVGMILDNRNHDMTYMFKSFKILFGEDCAIMEIERDESTMAGGADSQIQSGRYVLTP